VPGRQARQQIQSANPTYESANHRLVRSTLKPRLAAPRYRCRTCRVGHSWQRINAAIRRALSDVSLAQLAGLERGAIRSLNFGAGQPIPLTRATRAPSD
jgi:hypothetical protein